MKYIALFLSLSLILYSCKNTEKDKPVFSTPKEDCYGYLNMAKWRTEIFNIDSTSIDGEIPVYSSKDNLIKKFGKPDKITKIRVNQAAAFRAKDIPDETTYAERWKYGNSYFDVVNGIFTINTIDFESTDVTLVYKDIVLSKGLRFEEVRKHFPESCKLTIPGGNAWSGHIELFLKKQSRFDRWVLIFFAEKLSKVAIYEYF